MATISTKFTNGDTAYVLGKDDTIVTKHIISTTITVTGSAPAVVYNTSVGDKIKEEDLLSTAELVAKLNAKILELQLLVAQYNV